MANKSTISSDDVAQMLNKFDLNINVTLSGSEAARLADYFEDADTDSAESSDESSASDNKESNVASDDSDMDDSEGDIKCDAIL